MRVLDVVGLWLIRDGPNVVLISVDTLRADRLGTYGYDRPTSPTIDRQLAAQGVTVESCYSQSPKTTPSHMTMLTSLYPCVHRIPLWEGTRPGPVLSPRANTLAEILKNAGYATAAFAGRGHMHRSRGFGQGFDVYDHGHQLERAMRWMRRHRHRKFFLFFHTYAVHDPYLPPLRLIKLFDGEYRGPVLETVRGLLHGVKDAEHASRIFWASVDTNDRRDVRFVRRLYDAAIRHMDESIVAPLLDELESLGLANNTLVVLTSDHGEAFGEHGAFRHGDLYTETLRVPLIFRFPGRLLPGHRVRGGARVVDVMPTILDLLQVSAPPTVQGRSIGPLMRGGQRGEAARDVVSEYSNAASGRVFESLRRGSLTYIVDGSVEQLFDKVEDPGEQENLARNRHIDLESMRAELSRWRQECRRLTADFGPRDEAVAPSAETVRHLRALGYLN
jgi:arylsulfatase A-like enzyme